MTQRLGTISLKLPVLVLTFILMPFCSVKALENVVVQLRWHHQFQFAGYYAAREKGYYRDKGIEVTLKPIQPDMSTHEEVLSGRAHFSQTDVGLLVSHSQGKPLVALAATFQYSPSTFISLSSSGIRRPEDFKGKKVMLFPDNENLALLALLEKFNLMNDVVRLNTSTEIQDLVEGNTDVFNAYTSNEPYALESMGLSYNLITPRKYGIEFYGDVIFTSQDLVDKEPQLVADFTEATLKGWRFALDNPEEVIQWIISVYHAPKSKDHLRFEENMLRQLMMPELIPVGHMNKERWLNIQEELKRMGIVHKQVNMSQFIYDYQAHRYWEKVILWGTFVFFIFIIMGWFLQHYVRMCFRLQKEVSLREIAEKKAINMALHDPLTGLPNRLLFKDRLEHALKRKEREDAQPLVMFIDLDNFKQVNDTYGHDAGDRLLKNVADALSRVTRVTDTCARIAGDEFIIVTENCNSKSEAEAFVNRTLHYLELRLSELDPSQQVSVSIGAVLVNMSVTDGVVYKKSDELMYEAKRSKRHHYVIKTMSECCEPLKSERLGVSD